MTTSGFAAKTPTKKAGTAKQPLCKNIAIAWLSRPSSIRFPSRTVGSRTRLFCFAGSGSLSVPGIMERRISPLRWNFSACGPRSCRRAAWRFARWARQLDARRDPLKFRGGFRMLVTLATNLGNGISPFLPRSTIPFPSILRHLQNSLPFSV